jgi:predicted NBD/HSP70 family sugar kinase
MIALGIDIGGTSVKMAALDLQSGRAVWTSQSGFYSRPTTERLIEAIASAAAGHITPEAHFAIAGLCVPGLYDKERRMITLSINVPGLMNVVLDELIARAIGAGVVGNLRVINDAIATATDVIASHGLTGRVCAIALGTGVGMGVLDDGVPLYVDEVSPGHIGQVDCSIEGAPAFGPDGGAGSLEAYIGVPALTKKYGSMDNFFSRVTADDPAIKALVRAIRICHAIYRPHHFVLVGGIGTRLKRLVPEIKLGCEVNLSSIARKDWTLSAGDHDFHAALGAARVAALTPSPSGSGPG